MTSARNSNSLIADDSCPAVTTVDVVSSPESPTSTVVVLANPVSTSPPDTAAAGVSREPASAAAFSFSDELIATWLLQPRASELPAMRKYASTFRVAAASVIHSASRSTTTISTT